MPELSGAMERRHDPSRDSVLRPGAFVGDNFNCLDAPQPAPASRYSAIPASPGHVLTGMSFHAVAVF
jgi:hypothetical protein